MWFAARGAQEPSIPFWAAEGTGFSQVRIHPGSDRSDLSAATALLSGPESCLHTLAGYTTSPVPFSKQDAPPPPAPARVIARLRGSCSEPLEQKNPSPPPRAECKQQGFSWNVGQAWKMAR